MTTPNTTAATPVLLARGISMSYGSIKVLQDVAIDVHAGRTHAVIGPNGAGKTTLFKVLSGEVLPDAGSVTFLGQQCERLDAWQRVRLGMGRTFQVARVFAETTVLQNMVVAVEARALQSHSKHNQPAASRSNMPRMAPTQIVLEEAQSALAAMGLSGLWDTRAGVLAYGDRKRLELALALALAPQLLLLDEPMAGMSPADRSAAVKTIQDVVRQRGISVLLTEHDMQVVFALADHVTVLHHGQVLASGTPQAVRDLAEVRAVYLGEETAHA